MSRLPADGTHGQADRYMGECPTVYPGQQDKHRVNYGDSFVVRGGKVYCAAHDPTPDPVICQPCGTVIDVEAAGSRFPCCDACTPLRHVALWCVKGLQDAFAPLDDAQVRRAFGRRESADVVRYGPRGARDVQLAQRQAAWRDLG